MIKSSFAIHFYASQFGRTMIRFTSLPKHLVACYLPSIPNVYLSNISSKNQCPTLMFNLVWTTTQIQNNTKHWFLAVERKNSIWTTWMKIYTKCNDAFLYMLDSWYMLKALCFCIWHGNTKFKTLSLSFIYMNWFVYYY